MGHVRKVPSKRQAVVDDDTKLNLLLALEENPITPAQKTENGTMRRGRKRERNRDSRPSIDAYIDPKTPKTPPPSPSFRFYRMQMAKEPRDRRRRWQCSGDDDDDEGDLTPCRARPVCRSMCCWPPLPDTVSRPRRGPRGGRPTFASPSP
ncbi:hypothetical protein NQ318_011621 [Aromia moschata]|uniref:Uncharacterized protein n=1 Tax=Aromia moschata TaxID=1265417 RepID=A0AAV8Z8X6_9CUCU|nr:hypothetical protein NQ318_011621 [Aromia moschata]